MRIVNGTKNFTKPTEELAVAGGKLTDKNQKRLFQLAGKEMVCVRKINLYTQHHHSFAVPVRIPVSLGNEQSTGNTGNVPPNGGKHIPKPMEQGTTKQHTLVEPPGPGTDGKERNGYDPRPVWGGKLQ